MATLCLGVPALAQDDPEEPAEDVEEVEDRGRELYDNGVLLYDQGRYEDAIVAWSEGHRLTERPAFLFNIANAQERLGQYAEAIDTLAQYSALARADERETLERRVRNLEQRLADTTPSPQPVVAPPAPVVPEAAPKVAGQGNMRTVVGGSLVGVGVGGLGVGTFLGLKSLSAASDAKAQCTETGLCPSGAQTDLDANQSSALGSDISFVVGALVGGAGAVVLLTGKGSAVSVEPGRGLLMIGGRF